jgi:hypothetical protein
MRSPGRVCSKDSNMRIIIRQVAHPEILATQEAEIRRITVQSQPRQIVCKTLSKKYRTHIHTQTHKGLVEWVKVKALSLSPNTKKKKKEKENHS